AALWSIKFSGTGCGGDYLNVVPLICQSSREIGEQLRGSLGGRPKHPVDEDDPTHARFVFKVCPGHVGSLIAIAAVPSGQTVRRLRGDGNTPNLRRLP